MSLLEYQYQPQKKHIHCIINEPAVNLTVNLLHSSNFKVSTSCNQYEIDDFIQNSNALSVNLGGLNQEKISFLKEFHNPKIAWGLDPVMIDLSSFRFNLFTELLKQKPTLIRCNLAEFRMIADWLKIEKNDILQSLRKVSNKLDCIIALTGIVDYICYQNQCYRINSGHIFQKYITGMGCAISALLIAQYTCHQDIELLAKYYCVLSNLASQAGKNSQGPQEFILKYIDLCFNLFQKKNTIHLYHFKKITYEA